jgi:hypothetical protein
MAGKTLSELTDDLRREIADLRTQVAVLEAAVESASLTPLRERLAKTEALLTALTEALAELKKHSDESERRGERLAVLESQLGELKRQFDEKDRRWWQFWAGVALVGFTFVANLLIQLFLLFSRKPG